MGSGNGCGGVASGVGFSGAGALEEPVGQWFAIAMRAGHSNLEPNVLCWRWW